MVLVVSDLWILPKLRCTGTCGMLCLQCTAQREYRHFTAACLRHWWRCFHTLGCSSSSTKSLRICWLHRPSLESQEVSGAQAHASAHHSRDTCSIRSNLSRPVFKETCKAWSVAAELEWLVKRSHTPLTSSRKDCKLEALKQPDSTLDR